MEGIKYEKKVVEGISQILQKSFRIFWAQRGTGLSGTTCVCGHAILKLEQHEASDDDDSKSSGSSSRLTFTVHLLCARRYVIYILNHENSPMKSVL